MSQGDTIAVRVGAYPAVLTSVVLPSHSVGLGQGGLDSLGIKPSA